MDEKNSDSQPFDEEDKEEQQELNNEEEKEGDTVEQHKATIADYQDKLKQIDELIEAEKNDPKKVAELEILKKEIKDAISYSMDLIKLKETDQGKIKVSNRLLTERDKGKVCEAFFETEKQWFAGSINNVNVEQQTAEIDWIGYTGKATLPAKFIKVAKHPDPSQIEEGYF